MTSCLWSQLSLIKWPPNLLRLNSFESNSKVFHVALDSLQKLPWMLRYGSSKLTLHWNLSGRWYAWLWGSIWGIKGCLIELQLQLQLDSLEISFPEFLLRLKETPTKWHRAWTACGSKLDQDQWIKTAKMEDLCILLALNWTKEPLETSWPS